MIKTMKLWLTINKSFLNKWIQVFNIFMVTGSNKKNNRNFIHALCIHLFLWLGCCHVCKSDLFINHQCIRVFWDPSLLYFQFCMIFFIFQDIYTCHVWDCFYCACLSSYSFLGYRIDLLHVTCWYFNHKLISSSGQVYVWDIQLDYTLPNLYTLLSLYHKSLLFRTCVRTRCCRSCTC